MSPLKPLYAIAIAFLVVAFVGFGISAFYPEPEYPESENVGEASTEEEQQQVKAENRRAYDAYWERLSDYNKVVASIAVGVAVLLLVGSILGISRLPVIGDGVTLGAVFTLFYGLIRAFMTNDERFRFVAVAVGLVVLVALVYWKFARPLGEEKPGDDPPGRAKRPTASGEGPAA